MQHLNEEQLVLHRYHDDGPEVAAVEQHLNACAECRAQYDTLCRVLALVDELPVDGKRIGFAPRRTERVGDRPYGIDRLRDDRVRR